MTEKPLVLLTHELPADWIGNQLDDCQIVIGDNELRGIDEQLQPYLEKASGILCLLDDPIPQEIIYQAKDLKVISNYAVGVDNIDVEVCTNLGIPVGHTPGVLTDGTADLTLALLLSVCRNITQASADAMEGRWASWEPTGWLGVDLNGATIGIVGMGKIGSAVAKRLSAFGAKLIFSNRTPLPELAHELAAKQVDLDELLRISDIVCLHVPLNEDTFKMINTEAFQKMKSTAILINAARGSVVDTDALQIALESGQIRAAGLDVTDPEPLPKEHPLYQLENCLITPHIGSATYNTRKTMAKIALDNLRAGLNNQPLPHCVNPEVYS